MIKKLIRVPVQTPNGEKHVKFFQFTGEDTGGKRPCEEICPYAEFCDKIPDPREPKNEERKFMDFCGELGSAEGDDKYIDVIPAEGAIEEELSDVIGDVYQDMIKEKKLVKVDRVIKAVCSGWCEKFSEDFKNCTAENKSCILAQLFKNEKEDDTPVKE